jgi:hypothetical protein
MNPPIHTAAPFGMATTDAGRTGCPQPAACGARAPARRSAHSRGNGQRLFALNNQLCVRQPKSNPFRVVRGGIGLPVKEVGAADTAPLVPLLETSVGDRGSERRPGVVVRVLWGCAVGVLVIAVNLCAFGAQRVHYSRLEHQWAQRLAQGERRIDQLQVANRQLHGAVAVQYAARAVAVPQARLLHALGPAVSKPKAPARI